MENKLHSGFRLFKLKGPDEIHVAVPASYVSVVFDELLKNGDIAGVPSDKTIRGIFLEKTDGELLFDENAQQNDIVINQLIII
ncbi:MAG: hypothetical protein H0W73_17540 [Bacteroidetes bacterium]|nr:hypothetical protein [Bacteroidota bacterium]